MATIKVTQTKSSIGRLPKHKACLKGLGLRKINHTVELEDTPCVRGMINKVSTWLKLRSNHNAFEYSITALQVLRLLLNA